MTSHCPLTAFCSCCCLTHLKAMKRALCLTVTPCRAAAHSKLGNYTEATGDCERAIGIDPTYSKAYGRMGWVGLTCRLFSFYVICSVIFLSLILRLQFGFDSHEQVSRGNFLLQESFGIRPRERHLQVQPEDRRAEAERSDQPGEYLHVRAFILWFMSR